MAETGAFAEASKLRNGVVIRLRTLLGPDHPTVLDAERGRRSTFDIEPPAV